MSMIVSSRLPRRTWLLFVLAIVWFGGFSMTMALGDVDNVEYQGSFPSSTTSGLTQATLTINGNPRDLLIYRPSTAQSLPLMIFFGGTGSDLASIKSNDGYLRDYADTGNFIIAVPAQRVMSYGDWDNHYSETPYWETAVGDLTSSAASSNPDTNPDLLFTRAIIKEASVAYGADLTRVYVNGFSNGAFFSYFVAAILSDRIAAFAETGGGLVMSNTTAGEPTPCAPTAIPAATGAVRSCTDAGWNVGLCSTPTAMARPIAPSSVARVPPGFMEANDDDDSVSFAHTCNLAYALPVSPNYQVRIVHSNGVGHSMNSDYLDNSWNFMKNFSTAASTAVASTVVEFYNTNLDNYFITADANEAAAIDGGSAGPGWIRTGNSFKSGGSTPVCRFYGSQSPGPNSHFYTVDVDECTYLKQLQESTPGTQKRWNYESLDFISTPPSNGTCLGGTVPVYRAYNNGFTRSVDSNHRITSSQAAIQEVESRGWSNEGVVMCAPI